MSSSPYIGAIFMFAGNFAPTGYMLCQGQLLPIAQYTALFSILGTTYGGNGQTNFGLPDLQGRVPVGQGQGLGLSLYDLGEQTGSEAVTLNIQQIPAHIHALNAVNAPANQSSPSNNALAAPAISHPVPDFPANAGYSNAAVNTAMNTSSIGISGGNLPHSILQPVLAINYIIAITGVFPSRS